MKNCIGQFIWASNKINSDSDVLPICSYSISQKLPVQHQKTKILKITFSKFDTNVVLKFAYFHKFEHKCIVLCER